MHQSILIICLQVMLVALAAACPATIFAANSSSDIGENGQFARPFYIVGHNPNTFDGSFDSYLMETDKVEAAGANAFEPDLMYIGPEARSRADSLYPQWP